MLPVLIDGQPIAGRCVTTRGPPGVVLSAVGAVVAITAGTLGCTQVLHYHVDVHQVPSRNSPNLPSSTTI